MRCIVTVLLCVFSTTALAQTPVTRSNSPIEATTQAAYLYALMIKIRAELKFENGKRLQQEPELLFRSASLILEISAQYQKDRASKLQKHAQAGRLDERPFEKYSSCATAAAKLADFMSFSAQSYVETARITELYSQFSGDFAECKRVRTPRYFYSNRSVRF